MQSLKFLLFSCLSFTPCFAWDECEDVSPGRQGGFIELGLGYGFSTLKTKHGDVPSSYKYQYDPYGGGFPPKGSQNGAVGSLSMGYNWLICKGPAMVGFFGGGSFSTLQGSMPSTVYIQGPNTASRLTESFDYLQVMTKGSANAGLRFGRWFNRALPFVKVGWTTARLTFKPDRNTSSVWFRSRNVWRMGTLVGLGVDVLWSKYTSFGVSGDFGFYSSKKTLVYTFGPYHQYRLAYLYSSVRPVTMCAFFNVKCIFPEQWCR